VREVLSTDDPAPGGEGSAKTSEGTGMVEFDRSAFIGKFQEEATEYLQRLNEGVITLEADPDNRELIDQMLRDAHTLKGSSRMVGLLDISNVAHRLEDIMVRIRDKEIAFTSDMSDHFFEALDAIVFLADNAGKEAEVPFDLEALQARLIVLATTGDSAAASAATPEAAAAAEAAEAAAKSGHKSTARGETGSGAGEASDEDLAGQDASAFEDTDGDEEEPTAASDADVSADQKSGATRMTGVEGLKIKATPTIRVKTAQVDALLNLVSEVVISQIKAERRSIDLKSMQGDLTTTWRVWQMLKADISALGIGESRSAELLDRVAEFDGRIGEHRRRLSTFSKAYADDTSRSSTVVADLQEEGMRMRMLPATTILSTFPRAVRDLAKQFKKDIDLIIEGGETELDKKVLEEINDPLIHIMRNACDHGIESPEVRVAAGKPAKGTIKLSARQEGDHILVEISDDGGGIDPVKVLAAAVRKGYLTDTEASAMSDRRAIYLIFESGFSTSPIITEISGRGVGMDVVRQFIVDKLKGSLDVDSRLGKGTTFRLRIPLTLAIIRALMVSVGGHMFAVPTAAIEETIRVSPSDVDKLEGREIVRRQRRNIPLVRLGDILGLPSTAPDDITKLPIAIIGFSGFRIGFIVDAFEGEQQIVIKTLGDHLRKVDNVAGATILGAGEVVLILNIPDLMTNARTLSGLRVASKRTEEDAGPRKILICEDSFTTRELERSIFEAAGYEVEVAMDGAQGLQKLREGLKVDAVVTDVQMPNLTGFQLTKAIKADERLSALPVIIVTSLERDEEKAEGIEAGADAYITKSVFNQDTLLDTVERLIR
jgi:two-component system chemotaxis sensor kinase CheA